MNTTFRDIASDLIDMVRSNNLDDRISYRFLVNQFISKVSVFLRQDARTREVLRQGNIWKTINCVDLEPVAVGCCADLEGCLTLKRSTIKIPATYQTSYGITIKVMTIDGLVEFKQIQSFEYKAEKTREYVTNKNYFWLLDDQVYVPDSEIESVKVMLVAKYPSEVDKLNDINPCISPLDGEVNYPDYLVAIAKQEILKELLGRTQIVEDEKGDDNTNKKN